MFGVDYGARMFLARGFPQFTTVDPRSEWYFNLGTHVYVGNNPVRFIDEYGMSWREGWQHLKQSFSARVSVGVQIAGNAKVGDLRVGGELNFASMDVVTINNSGVNVNIANGDVRQGAEASIGVASMSKEHTIRDNNDNTVTRTTTQEATVLGIGVENTTSETYQKNGDGSLLKANNSTVTETNLAAPDKMELGIKAIIGVEIEVDTRLFIKGLDEIFKGDTNNNSQHDKEKISGTSN